MDTPSDEDDATSASDNDTESAAPPPAPRAAATAVASAHAPARHKPYTIQIQAANDAFNQKTAQYRAGIITVVDLTNASYVLYRSQSEYVQTVSDWLLSNLDKAAANGNLDLFIQSIK